MHAHSSIPRDWAPAACVDLVNSRFNDHLGSGEVYDRLPDPVFRRAFLKRWGYRVDDPDASGAIARLARLRTLLRAVLEAYGEGRRLSPLLVRRLETAMNRTRLTLSLGKQPSGYQVSARRFGDPWEVVLADIATSAARLIGEGRRVKVCANPHCSWMFIDESKPGTRRWCNVSVCGSLINVRRHRSGRARRR